MAKKHSDDNQDDTAKGDFGPDPEQHPDAQAFTGHLRQTSDRKGWRLYLSLDFNDFLEIPPNALISHRNLASRGNPLAGDIVWVRGGATLRRVTISVREAQAEFLRGEIMQQNIALSEMGIPIPGQQPTTLISDISVCRPCDSRGVCPIPTVHCNRPTMDCPSRICPSRAC